MNRCCEKRERNSLGACRHCNRWMPRLPSDPPVREWPRVTARLSPRALVVVERLARIERCSVTSMVERLCLVGLEAKRDVRPSNTNAQKPDQ